MTRRKVATDQELRDRAQGLVIVGAMLDEWTALRHEIAAMERAEHLDIIDRHGRAWVWRGRGDLYSHDQTLAIPADWVPEANLQPEALADNWNYWRLCSICTSLWSPEALAKHAQNAVDQEIYARVGWDGLQEVRRDRGSDGSVG